MAIILYRPLRNTERRFFPKEDRFQEKTLRNVRSDRQASKIGRGRQEWGFYFHSTGSHLVTQRYLHRVLEEEVKNW